MTIVSVELDDKKNPCEIRTPNNTRQTLIRSNLGVFKNCTVKEIM